MNSKRSRNSENAMQRKWIKSQTGIADQDADFLEDKSNPIVMAICSNATIGIRFGPGAIAYRTYKPIRKPVLISSATHRN